MVLSYICWSSCLSCISLVLIFAYFRRKLYQKLRRYENGRFKFLPPSFSCTIGDVTKATRCIVMLHGFAQSHKMFMETARKLAETDTVVLLIDLIGFGKSSNSSCVFTIEARPDENKPLLSLPMLAAHVQHELEVQKLSDMPLILTGVSMGSAVAQFFVANNYKSSKFVQKLVLICPAGYENQWFNPLSVFMKFVRLTQIAASLEILLSK